MEFKVGPYNYALVITSGLMFDDEGNELLGLAVEDQRLLILSHKIRPEEREGILFHEYTHAWGFHGASPTNEEERCRLNAMMIQQFNGDLSQQGGREALEEMDPERMGNIGQATGRDIAIRPATPAPPLPDAMPPIEIMGQPDRLPCATCEAPVMCGSIHHDDPVADGSGRVRMLRWFSCEACGSLQIWWEHCDQTGMLTGVYVSVPRPRVLNGAEAAKWLKEHRQLATA